MNQATDLTLPCLVHDLNNVFQTLVEAADLLAVDPQWAAVSAVILRSVERGKGITTGMQQAEQTSSEQPAAPFETILGNAIAFTEDSLIGGRGPQVRFVCDVEPGIELRRTWAWERVLINLFSNAMRAMPEGGTIYVSARIGDDYAEIVVRDEGDGIPPEILADLFRPHVSTKARGGLGLHIVETIVNQEDGEVRASNRRDGRGAEFVITIPATVPAEKSMALAAHA
jgi:signal transduction histidine kinase